MRKKLNSKKTHKIFLTKFQLSNVSKKCFMIFLKKFINITFSKILESDHKILINFNFNYVINFFSKEIFKNI